MMKVKVVKPMLVVFAWSLLSLFLALTFLSCDDGERPVDVNFDSKPVGAKTQAKGEKPLGFAIAPVLSPEKTVDTYQLFLAYLSKKLGRPFQMIQRKTYLEINEHLRLGEAAFGIVCTGAYIAGEKAFGLQALAIPQYQGKTEYYSFLIVRADSRFHKIEDLRGRNIALSDPLSNSGYFYPMYLMLERQENVVAFFKRKFFTNSHDESIQSVLNGLADGAFVDSLIYDYEIYTNPKLEQKFRIIHKSPPFGINPVVVSPSTPSGLRDNIKQILLDMCNDSQGRKVLSQLRLDRFVEPDDQIYNFSKKVVSRVMEMK